MRFAVLGLGSAGSRHARNLRSLGHTVAGWDPGRLDDSEAASPEEALDRADAAVVASPSYLHAEHALLAIEHGTPVLVEKPLATELADATRVRDAAAAAGVACGVAMNLRFHPALVRLRTLIGDGTLGPVWLASAWFGHDLRLWRPADDYRRSYSARCELGGGILLDAIHELDYLLWLLGPVAEVSAELDRLSDLEIDVEDTALLTLRFRGGARASVGLEFHGQTYRRGCVLVGAAGTAEWDWSRESLALGTRERREESVVPNRVADTYTAELKSFCAAVGAGELPFAPAEDGVAALALVDAARRSAAEGRRIAVAAAPKGPS